MIDHTTTPQRFFTLDAVLASPTPEPLRLPNGKSMVISEYRLAGGSAALVMWSRWYGASIALHSRLSVVDKLRALRWATEVLEEHVQVDPENDLRRILGSVDDLPGLPAQPALRPAQLLPGALDQWGQGVGTLVCIGCGSEFYPDSSPHLDRCWICAELADTQAGVEL